jgi:hypothetical protein
MVRKLVVPFSMVVLMLAAVLMTGCGEGSDRIVSPGQTSVNEYNFFDGIDQDNPGQYSDQTLDSLTSASGADDAADGIDEDEAVISTGEEDEPPVDDDPWFKDKKDREDRNTDQ